MSLIKGSTVSPSPPQAHGSVIPVKVDSSGRVYIVSESGTHIFGKVANDLASGGPYYLLSDTNGALVLASHTSLTQSDRVEEIDPLSQHYTSATLVDETNYNDAGPSTLHYYVDNAGYTRNSFQYDQNQGTGTIVLTIEATWQDDGTTPSSCAYEDLTMALIGAPNVNGTATGVIIDNAGVMEGAKYIRIKFVVNTDPADDADFTVYHNRVWR